MCRSRQGAHIVKPFLANPAASSSQLGRDDVPHERTDYQVVHPLRSILDLSTDIDEIRWTHEQDADTKWFGVVREHIRWLVMED